jgi:sugar phosphate isomerase/epimerase
MRLGISSYTFTWAVGVPGQEPDRPMSARGLLSKAAELGVGVVQIADNLPLHDLPAGELDELARSAGELGVEVEVGTRGVRPEHLRTYLRIARRLGSKLLRVVVDTADDEPDADEIVRRVRAVAAELASAGVCLAIENHDRLASHELAAILDRIGGEAVGVCLDTVNSFGALEGPAVVVQTLAPYVVNVHVKDFAVVRAGHMMGFRIEGRAAGQGRLDVPWLLEALGRRKHRCNAILELWTPPADDLAATVAREADWARQSVEYLRTLIPT